MNPKKPDQDNKKTCSKDKVNPESPNFSPNAIFEFDNATTNGIADMNDESNPLSPLNIGNPLNPDSPMNPKNINYSDPHSPYNP